LRLPVLYLNGKLPGGLRSVPKAFGTLGAAIGALMRVKTEYGYVSRKGAKGLIGHG